MESKKTAVVTGGASGIGFAVAKSLLESGFEVVLVGRDESRLAEAAEKLGEGAKWRQADVARREQLEAAFDRFETISVLVNAAGFIRPTSLTTPPAEAEDNWDAVVGANLKGSFLTATLLAPKLASPGGRVINISSIGAQAGGSRPGGLAYAAAKSGLHGLTFALARELAPRQITANVVAPGFIASTGFTGTWSEERVKEIIDQIPLGRAGCPEDVAGAVCWLASDAASFVTGTVISVNGGWRIG